jgi:hypothetical protein
VLQYLAALQAQAVAVVVPVLAAVVQMAALAVAAVAIHLALLVLRDWEQQDKDLMAAQLVELEMLQVVVVEVAPDLQAVVQVIKVAARVQVHLLQVQALLVQVAAQVIRASVVRVAAVLVLQEMEFQAAMEVQTQVAVQVVRKAQVAEQVDQDLSAFATLILLILQYQQQDRHQ